MCLTTASSNWWSIVGISSFSIVLRNFKRKWSKYWTRFRCLCLFSSPHSTTYPRYICVTRHWTLRTQLSISSWCSSLRKFQWKTKMSFIHPSMIKDRRRFLYCRSFVSFFLTHKSLNKMFKVIEYRLIRILNRRIYKNASTNISLRSSLLLIVF